MNRISEAFQNKKAFIPFITGGDPSLVVMQQLILAMQEAGADLIGIGIPFSDPIAEGIVIQAADERALAAGCTTDKLFDAVRDIREQVHIPLVFMTYINPVYTYGKERFLKRCVECGMAGVIVPDLPFEEKEELSGICKAYGVELVSLIAPTSHERIEMIAKEAEGFLYGESFVGEAGVCNEVRINIKEMIDQVRKVAAIPCAIGLEFATSGQVREIAAVADGVIVGSAIVKIVAEYGENCVPYVTEYVKTMKAAVMEADK